MLNKTIVTALALGALLTGSVALAQTNTGSTTPPQPPPVFKPLPVIFPITELGGCTSKEACRVYCETAAHHDACFAYAKTHGLMRAEEIEKARQFIKERASSTPKMIPGLPLRGNASSSIEAILAAGGGPGGCTTRDACKTYCDDTAHSAECLAFAKAHNLMTGPEIERAKKLHDQVGPGGCKGEQCKEYCKDSEHIQVCVTFAEQNGFISNGDAERRLERVKFASTTRPLPIKPDGERGPATGAFKPNPKLNGENHGSTTKPFINSAGTAPRPFNEKVPPPPPRPAASSSDEQGGSIFFAILHFFGI